MRKPRSEFPSEQADKFLVRLPAGMRDDLKAAADVNKRSMNAEIVARLEYSLLDNVERLARIPGAADDAEIIGKQLLEAVAHARTNNSKMRLVFEFSSIDAPDDEGSVSEEIPKELVAAVKKVANDSRKSKDQVGALQYILRDWLTSHGYLEHAERPKETR